MGFVFLLVGYCSFTSLRDPKRDKITEIHDNEMDGFCFSFEAPTSRWPESRPLILWLNGGTGCSSMAYGAAEEMWPFRIHPERKTLFFNPYAWNNPAKMLFLESPTVVGFSYSNTLSDLYTTSDQRTVSVLLFRTLRAACDFGSPQHPHIVVFSVIL
ncbi:PREDICTED: serine carboxypeptidase-like 26 [Nelumbo nucifera]|uniref:Serine carboxypeptidase-like 26 n=2 Tax=Nelumbo nucifera TaxID=4432 RepID=A0A1U8AXR2_NELNU|nr:PREDICTED: serine carboxypeptidase-like 26 [Nelumbo nucifera]DAD47408.1 TPA_asm: hypothetical protein HUJ06_017345 [Nelumbo nucifera]